MNELDLDLVPYSILRLEQAASQDRVDAVMNGHRFSLWFAEREVQVDSYTRESEIVYRFDLSDPDGPPNDRSGGHISIHLPMGRAMWVHRS